MTLRDAACGYILDHGWAVFPLHPGSKKPHGELVPRGYIEASKSAGDVLYWWQREPQANVGIACRASGLIVLDVDPRHGGYESMSDLTRRLGLLPEGPINHTPTAGYHLLFQHPGETFMFRKEIADGVDIKDNGYIVAPPSVREMGNYAWSGSRFPIPDLPESWLNEMRRRGVSGERRERSEAPLMQIEAEDYIGVLTDRWAVGQWVQCPFHKGGEERTPSLKVEGPMWSCFGGCEPFPGKHIMGGNILDFAAVLWGYPLPLVGTDVAVIKAAVERRLREYHSGQGVSTASGSDATADQT